MNMIQKVKTMKRILQVAAMVAFALLLHYSGYKAGCKRIPTIVEMQKKIGCTKIDGKLGPQWHKSETQAKWRQAWMKQNPGKYMY